LLVTTSTEKTTSYKVILVVDVAEVPSIDVVVDANAMDPDL
jgi:hypothetical protein